MYTAVCLYLYNTQYVNILLHFILYIIFMFPFRYTLIPSHCIQIPMLDYCAITYLYLDISIYIKYLHTYLYLNYHLQ